MKTFRLNDIVIRDPFILPVEKERYYYLYGTTDLTPWRGPAVGFDAYRSMDLQNWQGPYPVFRPWENFWADENFWAPEVHFYNGRYYMFASFYAKNHNRGTQILVSELPQGPFTEHSRGPVTPIDWSCLDGTLYIEDNCPWIIFCHEWCQITDGQICAMRLTDDLTKAIGEPITLVQASEAPWCRTFVSSRKDLPITEGYVTDGPFMHRTKDRKLLMLWSGFTHQGLEGYAQGVSYSESGILNGPWKHTTNAIYADNGGHGMTFKTFDGQLMLTLHAPNRNPDGAERTRLFKIVEVNHSLLILV